ncbi:MAG: YhfC family glutamic-type intramembrane protease [Candidatus Thorarchaeota archaeon]
MTNINLLFLLQPSLVILLVVLLVVLLYNMKKFSKWILIYSFLAYALAISIKVIFQRLTSGFVYATHRPFVEGVYLGLQTMILEVGLAYVFANYGIKKNHLVQENEAGYGIGLAFWENGVLLGIIPLINLIVIYCILASGGSQASTLYNNLLSSQSSLFDSTIPVLIIVSFGIIERISSIMIHFAWGVLVFKAAFSHNNKYLFIALPMGLVDFFVPYYSYLGAVTFELIFFVIALISMIIALKVKFD